MCMNGEGGRQAFQWKEMCAAHTWPEPRQQTSPKGWGYIQKNGDQTSMSQITELGEWNIC